MKIIRCENAGENKVLERESDKNELGIIFEYTAPGTPQQNGVVEKAFVTVMGRTRAMMNDAGFTMAKRQQLWCEAAQTATLLNNILVQDSAKSPPFTQFFSRCKVCQEFKRFWRNVCCGRYIQEARSVYLLGTAPNM